MNYKDAAEKVLRRLGKPLHYKQITDLAINEGLIETEGKTPWATMNAQISMDIIHKGEESRFIRGEPGFYYLKTLRINTHDVVSAKDIRGMARIVRHQITPFLSTKQKGDIGELRVAELITLYGNVGLSCYRPMSDDEGIDIIVKRRGKLDVAYIQVKTTYGYKNRGFVSTVKEKSIVNKERMILIFVYFDLSEGDLFDQVFCIPAPDFLKLTENENKKPGERVFTVGLKNPDKSKYAEFMIEKRELADKIVEILDRI